MNMSSSGVESFLNSVDEMEEQWSKPRDGQGVTGF
jgi:hypothetical protein